MLLIRQCNKGFIASPKWNKGVPINPLLHTNTFIDIQVSKQIHMSFRTKTRHKTTQTLELQTIVHMTIRFVDTMTTFPSNTVWLCIFSITQYVLWLSYLCTHHVHEYFLWHSLCLQSYTGFFNARWVNFPMKTRVSTFSVIINSINNSSPFKQYIDR